MGTFNNTFNRSFNQIGSNMNPLPLLPERNSDIVKASGRVGIITGTPTANFSTTGRDNINLNNVSCSRQNGLLHSVQLYLNGPLISFLKLLVWRKNLSGTWDMVAESGDLSSGLIDGVNTIDLTGHDVSIKEGDYIGLEGVDSHYSMLRQTGYPENSYAYVNTSLVDYTDFDWNAQGVSPSVLPLITYQQAPLIVLIGGSSMAGHPGHYSGIEISFINNPAHSLGYQLYQLNEKYVCQQMGIGSQTSANVLARFDADCVDLKPKFAIIYTGINDLADGTVTKAQFIANNTSMLEKCALNDIIPIVLAIMPWTSGTYDQMVTRDEWNTDLKILAESYGYFVNSESVTGQYRATGTEGNLWNILSVYNSDNVHLNQDGYTALAAYIKTTVFDTYS